MRQVFVFMLLIANQEVYERQALQFEPEIDLKT